MSVIMSLLLATAASAALPSAPTTRGAPPPPPSPNSFPFPYNWSRFPAAWFGGNDTHFESDSQLDAIGKYSLAIFGWQHLITASNWTATLYSQIDQAIILKERHPSLPVFLYAGFGFAPGFDANIWPVIKTASDGCPGHQPCRKLSEPYTDWFLETDSVPVYSMSACEQMGLGYQNPPTDKCWNPNWNLANASARDFFIEHVLPPYATAPGVDGVFFDGFNVGYMGPSFGPWGRHATNIPNCTDTGGAGCAALVDGAIDLARRITLALNAAGKVPMFSNVGWFERPANVPASLWLDERRLLSALDGLQYMFNYEGVRAETLASSGQLANLVEESKRAVPMGVHTYMKAASEDLTPHIAAFLLFRAEHWYYFASTGWLDTDWRWSALFDAAAKCGKPLGLAVGAPAPLAYTRKYERCSVAIDCTAGGQDGCNATITWAPPRVSPRKTDWANSTEGVHAFLTFDSRASAEQISANGTKADFVWGASKGHLGSWAAANPNVVLSHYIPFSRDPAAGAHVDASKDGLPWWQSNHPSLVLYTCDRKTPAWECFAGEGCSHANVPLDLTQPEVLDLQMGWGVLPAKAEGYNAIALDNYGLSNEFLACGSFSGPNGAWVQKYDAADPRNDPKYRRDVLDWTARAVARMHEEGLLVIPNYSDDSDDGLLVANLTDGLLAEAGFAEWNPIPNTSSFSTPPPKTNPAKFERQVQFVRSLQRMGKGFFAINEWGRGPDYGLNKAEVPFDIEGEAHRPIRQFIVAAFMMVNGGRCGIFLNCIQCYGNFSLWPEYTADVGHPLGEPSVNSTNGVWTRAFSKSLALVNPSTNSSAVVSLPSSTGWEDLYGEKVTDSVEIPSASGLVLLRASVSV